MVYIKRTHNLPIAEVRKDMLQNDIGVHVDYYPASDAQSNHCAWVCTDIDCPKSGESFNTYPGFIAHLRVHHGIQFSEVPLELHMRQRYYDIV